MRRAPEWLRNHREPAGLPCGGCRGGGAWRLVSYSMPDIHSSQRLNVYTTYVEARARIKPADDAPTRQLRGFAYHSDTLEVEHGRMLPLCLPTLHAQHP